jgi:hypothetical protein
VAAKRMGVIGWREDRFDRGPDDVDHFGSMARVMIGRASTGCCWLCALAIKRETAQRNDRWMATYQRGP